MEPTDDHDDEDRSPPTTDQAELFPDQEKTTMEKYVQGLNAFIHYVATKTWPDGFDLTKDHDLPVRMFRDYWRMRFRYQRDEERASSRYSTEQHGVGEHFEAFIHRKLTRHFSEKAEDAQPTHIDVGEHQPEDEHQTDDAKKRVDEFREEWS